jgi:hypothetical protein
MAFTGFVAQHAVDIFFVRLSGSLDDLRPDQFLLLIIPPLMKHRSPRYGASPWALVLTTLASPKQRLSIRQMAACHGTGLLSKADLRVGFVLCDFDTSYQYHLSPVKPKNGPTPQSLPASDLMICCLAEAMRSPEYSRLDTTLPLYHDAFDVLSIFFKTEVIDMTWEKPSFREISMNSEIGGYQEDFAERKSGDTAKVSVPAEQTTSSPDQATPEI